MKFFRTIKNLRNERTLYYTATYPRISPYLMGFYVAMLVQKLRKKKFLFSQVSTPLLIYLKYLTNGVVKSKFWEVLKKFFLILDRGL